MRFKLGVAEDLGQGNQFVQVFNFPALEVYPAPVDQLVADGVPQGFIPGPLMARFLDKRQGFHSLQVGQGPGGYSQVDGIKPIVLVVTLFQGVLDRLKLGLSFKEYPALFSGGLDYALTVQDVAFLIGFHPQAPGLQLIDKRGGCPLRHHCHFKLMDANSSLYLPLEVSRRQIPQFSDKGADGIDVHPRIVVFAFIPKDSRKISSFNGLDEVF